MTDGTGNDHQDNLSLPQDPLDWPLELIERVQGKQAILEGGGITREEARARAIEEVRKTRCRPEAAEVNRAMSVLKAALHCLPAKYARVFSRSGTVIFIVRRPEGRPWWSVAQFRPEQVTTRVEGVVPDDVARALAAIVGSGEAVRVPRRAKELIETYLRTHNMTNERLAKKAGVNETYIYKIKAGKYVSGEGRLKVAAIIGCNPEDLV